MDQAQCGCQSRGWRSLLWRKIGRCRRCMRWTIWGAIGSWAAFFMVFGLWRSSIAVAIGLGFAASFTLLLMAHLVVFTVRAVFPPAVAPMESEYGGTAPLDPGRRSLLARLAAAGGGAFLTALFGRETARAQAEAWTTLRIPCGTMGTLYTNTTTGIQRLTFRIAVTAACGNHGLVRVLCNGADAGGASPSSPGETHDILCELAPGQTIAIVCPQGQGQCEIMWTIAVTSTEGTTKRPCGIDNDVFGNATTTNEMIHYLVCNDGDCPWQPTCNGMRLVDRRTGAPFVLLPGRREHSLYGERWRECFGWPLSGAW